MPTIESGIFDEMIAQFSVEPGILSRPVQKIQDYYEIVSANIQPRLRIYGFKQFIIIDIICTESSMLLSSAVDHIVVVHVELTKFTIYVTYSKCQGQS